MFRYFSILLQELDVAVEEEFLDMLIHSLANIPVAQELGLKPPKPP